MFFWVDIFDASYLTFVPPISIGPPSCPTTVKVMDSSQNSTNPVKCDVMLTWQQPQDPPPVTFTTVTYCPRLSPNCGDSMNCTNPCTISGLNNSADYQFTVFLNNNCGSRTGCTGNMATAKLNSKLCFSILFIWNVMCLTILILFCAKIPILNTVI